EWRQGADIPAGWWTPFYRCYAMPYYRRGQQPYLPPALFRQLAASPMAAQLALAVAGNGDDMIAAAFYLFDDTSLYGRYWGSVAEVDGLHFELCYYQGIEFCIRQGLQRFDPGVQGEHKILRGFEPEITFSLHWLADARFQRAIAQFCEEGAYAVAAYQVEARSQLQYREVESGSLAALGVVEHQRHGNQVLDVAGRVGRVLRAEFAGDVFEITIIR